MGWSMLSAMVGTQLQRQDSEGEESWKLRQAASKWGLPLVKSLLFDVDDGEGEGHLASDGKPVRGHLTLRPRPSDIWIAHRDNCLWIAAGGENAHEMIRVAVKRCGDSGRAVRTRWLTVRVDLEQWMSWPKDDPTGLATLPRWLDSAEGAQWMGILGRTQTSRPTPLLDKVVALQGSKQAWLTLDGGKSGLTIEAELGAPLADWFFARQIDSQERMMEQMRKQQEDAVRKAKEAATDKQAASD
jgi:hypothetical protein